jgi:hypothetical protein
MIFSVWAPGAKSVDLVLAERRIALHPADPPMPWRTMQRQNG